MTYWIVIAMIAVAILAVAAATAIAPDTQQTGDTDHDPPAEEGSTADEHP